MKTGCFHTSATVNNAKWTCGCIYLSKLVFLFSLNKYPEVELLDHMIVLFSIFLKNLYTVFHSNCTDRQGLPRWQVKNPPANAGDTGDTGLIPGSGRSPGGENGSPLQCSCLENPMDRGAWRATVQGVAQSRTRLSVHSRTHKHIFPPTVHKGPLSSTSLPTLVTSCLLYNNCSNRREVKPHCGCDIHFHGG